MPRPPPAPSIPPAEDEPLELARFREEWKAEARRRTAGVTDENTATLGPSKQPQVPVVLRPQLGPSSQVFAGVPAALSSTSNTRTVPAPIHLNATAAASASLRAALGIYRRAVEHEQNGELDDALVLYRQAFRMEPNVDRAFTREEKIAGALAQAQDAGKKPTAIVTGAAEPQLSTDELTTRLQHTLALKSAGKAGDGVILTGTLATLLAGFPENLTFEPEVSPIEGGDAIPLPLSMLPDEVLVLVLRKLDSAGIERFAAVCRKARVVSLDSAIWRELVNTTYRPPQVPDVESMVPVVERYLADYRRVYVEHPRVRLDGVYISVCHYIRPGLSENHWVNVSHLITYHRYLRFFPNGQVLSLLTNEEHSPQQVIPLLKPTLRMKGLSVGTWHLSGTTVYLSSLVDASGHFPLPSSSIATLPGPVPISSHHHRESATVDHTHQLRYVFTMSLHLRSPRPVGRWNRLDIQSYDSVSLETGDVAPVVLKHERPFWFSKVRSYTS